VLDRPCRPSTSLTGGHRSVAPWSLGRVSVPRLGSSGRASTNPSFVGSACSSYDDVRFRAPSCRRSPSCFRAKASLSWGFCPRPPLLRASARACLSRGLVPPRSGTCSSQAPASLPLARPRSPTFAGCHGTPPRLRGLLPRGDRSPRAGVTRSSACCPSSGFLLWARIPNSARLASRPVGSTHGVVASVFAERWPGAVAFSVSHRSGEARRHRLTHPLEVRSRSPSCDGDLGFSRFDRRFGTRVPLQWYGLGRSSRNRLYVLMITSGRATHRRFPAWKLLMH
jgi:hypothetical protein